MIKVLIGQKGIVASLTVSQEALVTLKTFSVSSTKAPKQCGPGFLNPRWGAKDRNIRKNPKSGEKGRHSFEKRDEEHKNT